LFCSDAAQGDTSAPACTKLGNPESLGRAAESTRSYCSDDSVGTLAGDDKLNADFCSHLLPLYVSRTTACRIEGMWQETGSSQLTYPDQVNCGTGDHPGINVFSKVTGPPSHRGPTERMTDITLNELSRFFHMPITQASKELKVGLTVLKKRCREFGIPRWPHRKMKSLDSLIQNIQELGKGPEGKTSVPVMSAVKELEHQKRRMEERPGIELAERTKRLRQACFKASYKKRCQRQTNSNHQETEGDNSGDQLLPMAL